MEYLTQWGLACIVLHNILAKIGDWWDELFCEEEAPDIISFENEIFNSTLR